ncbi:hypothetical protein BDZ91DRAFT_715254 [Kalaharituber pfeilii]|nr:hypothetical protein BDZ91DRAFT_715254 [Kalaharituber pfeilii]
MPPISFRYRLAFASTSTSTSIPNIRSLSQPTAALKPSPAIHWPWFGLSRTPNLSAFLLPSLNFTNSSSSDLKLSTDSPGQNLTNPKLLLWTLVIIVPIAIYLFLNDMFQCHHCDCWLRQGQSIDGPKLE